MFKAATIIQAPTGKYIFVGRVPGALCNTRYETIEDAKVAAIDLMMAENQTFPVNVNVKG